MKLEDQVCTFDQAQQLKQLGVPQGSLFKWYDRNVGGVILNRSTGGGKKAYAAFTAGELGQLLARHLAHFNDKGILLTTCYPAMQDGRLDRWECLYPYRGTRGTGETEVQARANCLISLLIYLEKTKSP